MCNGVVGSIKCLQLDSCCCCWCLVGRGKQIQEAVLIFPQGREKRDVAPREKSRQVKTKYPMGLYIYTGCALDLLGVKSSPRRLFFEI